MSLSDETKSIAKQLRERYDRWFPLDWNQAENRPRALFRIFWSTFPIAVVGIIVGILTIIISGISNYLPVSGFSQSLSGRIIIALLNNQILGSAILVIGICVSGWVIGCRYLRDFGLEWSLKWAEDFVFGCVIGVLLYSGMVLIGVFAGWITITDTFSGFTGRVPILWIIAMFISYLFVGLREEVIFRSLLLTNTAEGLRGIKWFDNTRAIAAAVVVSSFGFALWHIGSSVSSLVFAGVSGLLFGIVYVWTHSIAIPVGYHTGWNFAYYRLYGMVPGTTNNILETSVNGPSLLLGGPNWVGLLSFLTIFVGLAIIGSYIYIREGKLQARSTIAVPDLHDDRTFWDVVHNPKQYIPFWDT